MENLTAHSAHLKSLQLQAAELASAGPALTALLDAEASRLSRKDEASRLIALRSAIIQKLDWARTMERAASYGHSKAKLTGSLVKLGAGIAIGMATQDKRLRAFSGHLLKNLGGKRCPFGTVMVCIGPAGVPDDVTAISISELARKSDREESRVISELETRGCLLFSERAFSVLIDRLADGVQEGRLLLPISAERLSQIEPSSCYEVDAKNIKWAPAPRPQ